MHFFIVFIFLLYCFQQISVECSLNWRATAKNLKDKLKNLYQKKLFPQKSDSVSVGPRPSSPLDYPRNEEILNKVEEIWNDYYECLETKNSAILSDKTISPYTIAAFTETYIDLECNVCASPENLIEESEWHYSAKPYIIPPISVDEDEHKQISGYTFTLNFYNLKKYHEGMYYCNLKNDVDAPYFLHVLKPEEEPTKEVKPMNAKKGPYPQRPLNIKDSNIVIWNEWTKWTDCSICGKVGKRKKIGYCKISLKQNLADDVTSLLVSTSLRLNISEKIVYEVEQLSNYFAYGIPCRSSLLPKKFREHNLIKNHPTEIMVGFCKVSCPTEVLVQVVNNSGYVIETVNNTAGEYSVYQELPAQPAGVERVNIYGDLNKTFILPCPNYLFKETPVEWSVGGKIWKKNVVEKLSKGRITLNDLNEIVFMYLQEIDLKIYSCFQKKQLVGVVKLNANRKPSYMEEYFVTLQMYPKIMFISIFITFTYVSIKMFLNASKAAAGEYTPLKKSRTFIEFLTDMYHDRYLGEIPQVKSKKLAKKIATQKKIVLSGTDKSGGNPAIKSDNDPKIRKTILKNEKSKISTAQTMKVLKLTKPGEEKENTTFESTKQL